ncbi:MAG: TetR/AcrR family transcriptional regulator [Nocardioides sp.]
MPRKTARRHQQGDESRQRILEATLAIAAERGYEGTSIGLVTEATGLPASSIYWHFRNKNELLAETLEYSYRRWREVTPTWSERPDVSDPEEEVRERVARAAEAIVQSPEFWRLGLMLALENRPVEPLARTRYMQLREETRLAIRQWWVEVLASEGVPEGSSVPDRLARFHLAFMDGLFVGVRSGAGWDRARLADLAASGMRRQALAWLAGGAA